MRRGQQATNSEHRGVQIRRNRTDGKRDYLRWVDPKTGETVYERHQGKTSKQIREIAVERARDLRREKAAIANQQLIPLSGADPVQTWVDAPAAHNTKLNRKVTSRFLRELEAQLTRGWTEIKRGDLKFLHKSISSSPGLSPSTKNKHIRAVRHFLSELLAKGHLLHLNNKDAILAELPKLKEGQRRSGRTLLPEDLKVVLGAALEADLELCCFLALAFATGCRPRELSQIEGGHLVDQQGILPHLVVHASKTNQNRKINLGVSPGGLEVLRKLRQQKGEGLLFSQAQAPSKRLAQPYHHFKRKLSQLSRKVRIEVSLKDFRSTCENYLCKLWPVEKVAKQIGHGINVAFVHYHGDANLLELEEGKNLDELAKLVGFFSDLQERLTHQQVTASD